MHKLTRRSVIRVIATAAGSTTSVLCPARLKAQPMTLLDWNGTPTDRPIDEDRLLTVHPRPLEIDISDLQPGEVAVIARPTDDPVYSETGMTQFVAIHRRTEDQIAFGQVHDRAHTLQDPRFFIVNLICTRRGSTVGLTGNPEAPFACTDRRGRQSSAFDPAGFEIGASRGNDLTIPGHALSANTTKVVLRLA